MAHRILFEEDVGIESLDKVSLDKLNKKVIIKEKHSTSLKNQNLIILGTREPKNVGTKNCDNSSKQKKYLENENLINSDKNKVLKCHTRNKQDILTNLTNTVETEKSNVLDKNNNDYSNGQDGKKAKKRSFELEILGADKVVDPERSQFTYDVFGGGSNVYRKNKLRKSEQIKSYKVPPILKLEAGASSKDKARKTGSLECSICQQEFNSKRALSLHVRYHTTVQQYTCSLCSEKFEKNSDLVAHKSTHTESFICNMCKLAFSDHCDYLVHNLTHTSKTTFICPECGLSYNKLYYKGHIYTHFVKKLTCSICPYVTNVESNLRKHEKNHKYTSTLSCAECGKVLKSKRMYEYHMGVHTGVKKHQCLYCGKCFSTTSLRNVHTRIHTGEKPFTCNICGQKFSQWTNLKRHQTTHEKQKNFVCEICGKQYFHKDSLKCHMEDHGNSKKKHECPECEASFATIGGLKTHTMYKHLKDRPVECKLCNVRFIDKNNMDRHIKSLYHRRNVYGFKKKGEDCAN